jgi:hypothetical protein
MRAGVRRRLARTLLPAAALLAASSARAADRYDPRLRFRTIETPHFSIHYHQGLEALARRLAIVAEEVRGEVARRLGVARLARTHVILVDQHDEAGGWATPLPINTIEIGAAPPATADLAGNADDWLRLVFAHEYAHILHLDRSRGLFAALRRVLGRAPPVMPNLFLPAWQVEGLATYVESAVTGAGRVASGGFHRLVAAAAREGRFEPLDRVNGGLVAWPGGHAPYAYGAFFHRWLARRAGERTLAELADRTAGRPPYLAGGAFRRAAGAPIDRLWAAFREDIAAETRAASPARGGERRLTHHGFVVGRPRWDVGGAALLYAVRNPHGFPALVRTPIDTGRPGVLAERFLGEAVGVAEDVLIFDQRELARAVALVSDLFVFDRRTGRVRRLTRDLRALDPDLAPDGRRVALVVNRDGARLPALLSLERRNGALVAGELALLDSGADVVYGAPRFSPDGRRLAAERRRRGGPWEIVLFDGIGSPPAVVFSSSQGRLADPEWLPDNRTILFAWERPGEPFNLFARDIETGDTWQVTALVDGARGAAVAPDGRTLAYVGYTVDGFDLFLRPLARDVWKPLGRPLDVDATATDREDERTRLSHEVRGGGAPAVVSDGNRLEGGFSGAGREVDDPGARPSPGGVTEGGSDESEGKAIAPGAGRRTGEGASLVQQAPASRSYAPFPAMLPRYWLPEIRSDDDRLWIGALTSGTDPLGRHRYAARLSWPSDGGAPDWDAAYVYDRWRAAAFLRAARESTRWQERRSTEGAVETGLLFPVRRVRWSQRTLAAWRIERDEAGSTVFDRQALRAGWALVTARRYGYSVSPEGGVMAGATFEHACAGGPRATAATLTGDLRGYLPGVGRHHVVALRLAAGVSTGAAAARRTFGAGGRAAPPDPMAFGRDAIGLVRGYRTDEATGTRAAAASAEYRLPLARIERGLGRWPLFVRQLHGALFVDAGHAWSARFRLADVKTAAGVELSADAVLGYDAAVTVSIGAAWRRDGSGRLPGGGVAYARVGRAF